ncbi:MAG: diol dehydratase small subunit [Oscillospiraceae bacterium]
MVIDEKLIAQMVKEILEKMPSDSAAPSAASASATAKVTSKDYPLSINRPELVRTSTGKSLEELTIESVMDGSIGAKDVRISPETLELQAQIAESVGRTALAVNFRRAKELIAVPDKRILEMYNALRPYRSTKGELLTMADELEGQYKAKICASLVREAAEVYEKRGRLRTE